MEKWEIAWRFERMPKTEESLLADAKVTIKASQTTLLRGRCNELDKAKIDMIKCETYLQNNVKIIRE